MIKVDVIIPVYNGEKYIKRCIKSVIENYRSSLNDKILVNLIIINDGSTDKTRVFIEECLAAENTNIPAVILDQQNSGVAAARNLGIGHIDSDYVLFLDADDWLPEKSISRLVKTAEKDRTDIVIGKSHYFIGKIPFSITAETWRKIRTDVINPSENNFLVEITPAIRAKLFRSELIRDSHFPKERIKWEDLALIPALLARTDRISYLNEAVYNYTVHMNTTARDFLFRCNVTDIIRSLDLLKENLRRYGALDKYSSEYQSMLTLHTLFRVENVITWIDAPIPQKKRIIRELLEELSKRYPDWKNDPILQNKEKRYKDLFFNFLLKIAHL